MAFFTRLHLACRRFKCSCAIAKGSIWAENPWKSKQPKTTTPGVTTQENYPWSYTSVATTLGLTPPLGLPPV